MENIPKLICLLFYNLILKFGTFIFECLQKLVLYKEAKATKLCKSLKLNINNKNERLNRETFAFIIKPTSFTFKKSYWLFFKDTIEPAFTTLFFKDSFWWRRYFWDDICERENQARTKNNAKPESASSATKSNSKFNIQKTVSFKPKKPMKSLRKIKQMASSAATKSTMTTKKFLSWKRKPKSAIAEDYIRVKLLGELYKITYNNKRVYVCFFVRFLYYFALMLPPIFLGKYVKQVQIMRIIGDGQWASTLNSTTLVEYSINTNVTLELLSTNKEFTKLDRERQGIELIITTAWLIFTMILSSMFRSYSMVQSINLGCQLKMALIAKVYDYMLRLRSSYFYGSGRFYFYFTYNFSYHQNSISQTPKKEILPD